MSIYFDFNVEPNGKRFRRAVDADKNNVNLFWKPQDTFYLFGEIDVGSLIELSTLSICLVDETNDVLGLIVLNDYPNLGSVDPAAWEWWMRNLFQKYYLSCNTLFVHFSCCHPSVADSFLDDVFLAIFKDYPYCYQIVLIVPDSCPREVYIRYSTLKKNIVKRHHCIWNENLESAHHIYVASRSHFFPKYKIRRAVEEDNDDIIDILEPKCHTLTELYGQFYISELIGRHPEMNRNIIVAEVENEHAGGVMCINTDINYKKLQVTYELGGFHGLCMTTPIEIEKRKRDNCMLETFAESIMLGECTPYTTVDKVDQQEASVDVVQSVCLYDFFLWNIYFFVRTCPGGLMCQSFRAKIPLSSGAITARASKAGKIVFKPQSRNASKLVKSHEFQSDEFSESQFPLPLIDFRIEEDPFEYEIVNIDNTLLSTINLHQSLLRLHGIDLLEGAFEVMAKLEYCILRLPHSERHFPLLHHFTNVPSKALVHSEYCLYVAHRSSVLGKLRVRVAEVVDIPQITLFLNSLQPKETVWMIENNLLSRAVFEIYLFFSGLSIVGVAVIDKNHGDMEYLRKDFNLDDFHNRKYHFTGNNHNVGFCYLKTALVYPVFEPHYRFFIREILRLSGCNCMVWMSSYKTKIELRKMNSFVISMIPLIPRIIDYVEPKVKKHRKKNKKPIKAWFIDRKLSSLPKFNIDTRILIIGASKTSLAFLHQLLFSDASTYLTFTNITLISNEGFPHPTINKEFAYLSEYMFPYSKETQRSYCNHIPYTFYCHIVKGVMVEINKQDKFVRTASRDKYHYDLLFLLVGKQYQHPKYLQDIWEHTIKAQERNAPYMRMDNPMRDLVESGQWAINTPPDNVFIINNVADAAAALGIVNEITKLRLHAPIIVYGATIHAYCCITTLLKLKVGEEKIIFVEPFPPENPKKTRVPVFANNYVDETMRNTLEQLGITVYRGYYFQDWILDDYNRVEYVKFISHYQMVELRCACFFYYGKRGVDTNAYIAIHKSGICYDGGILTDQKFRTRDPAVYAAGPVTRYCGKIYASNVRQKYYDSYELGTKLGSEIRNMLDPTYSEPRSEPPKRHPNRSGRNVSYSDTEDVPETELKRLGFKEPRVTQCKLPGGYNYLEVIPPGFRNPHHYLQSMHYNGFVMETTNRGYFKLHFDYDFILDGITCLTQDNYRMENFARLYGLPAVVLNNIHLRYAANKISCFYNFFMEPWAYFLYHDQRDELLAIVKELTPKGSPHGKTIRETLIELGDRCVAKAYQGNTKEFLRSNLDMSPYVQEITNYVIEWLSENDTVLPMYLQPWQVGHFLRGVQNHPAFQKKKQTTRNLLLNSII